MAIEAIEGTDRCIKRGGKLAKGKNAIVVKVSKPAQDKRFDIPAVGLRTIKTMKKYGANVLALESGETIIVNADEMIKFANFFYKIPFYLINLITNGNDEIIVNKEN